MNQLINRVLSSGRFHRTQFVLSLMLAIAVVGLGRPAIADEHCAANGIRVSVEKQVQKLVLEGFPVVSFQTAKTCDMRQSCSYHVEYQNPDGSFAISEDFTVSDICNAFTTKERFRRNSGGSPLPYEVRQYYPVQTRTTYTIWGDKKQSKLTMHRWVHHLDTESMRWGFWHGNDGSGGGSITPTIVTYDILTGY